MNKIKIYLDDVRTPVNVVPENPDNYDVDWEITSEFFRDSNKHISHK
jgi:hypothetical protein